MYGRGVDFPSVIFVFHGGIAPAILALFGRASGFGFILYVGISQIGSTAPPRLVSFPFILPALFHLHLRSGYSQHVIVPHVYSHVVEFIQPPDDLAGM